ncbi:MAG: hypothetical protein JW811_03910 [Clostridiales bacterium]|nr:hypothetical protein [Clostridiales bacterium]
MSTGQTITIPVKLDKATFRRFASFDTFRRQQRWRMPVWFLLIMLGFSMFLYFQTDKPQAALIATVLLLIGLGLPVIYFTSFYLTLRQNVKKHKLPRRAYTLRLTGSEVYIRSEINSGEELTLNWNQLFAAYRVKGAVYLYVLPTRAFLLPDGQADIPDDELWAFISKRLRDKSRSLRKER